jgi:predicted Fe-Mo cluster-binding NifX family protein
LYGFIFCNTPPKTQLASFLGTYYMKVAIPIFRNVVSPRVDISDGLLIYEIDNDVVKKKERYSLNFDQPDQLISILQKNGITTIICGGCPHFFLRMLFVHDFDVLPGLTGDPEHIIKMLIDGKLKGLPASDPVKWQCRRGNRLNRSLNKEKRKKI